MTTTSTNTNGLTVTELTAALTKQQHADLEQFAAKRLKKSASTPARQRALAIYCGRSLFHAAFERFAMGEAGWPGGRRLKPHQRTDTGAFVHALRGAINSLIQHTLADREFGCEHLEADNWKAQPDQTTHRQVLDQPRELEFQDLQRQLFDRLDASAGADERMRAAVEALRQDCVTGHCKGVDQAGVDYEAKRVVRQQAQREWELLNS